jgi:hypothetical protein
MSSITESLLDYESHQDHSDTESNSLDESTDHHKVDILIQGIRRDQLMDVLQFIDNHDFEHTFNCSPSDDIDDECSVENNINKGILTIQLIRDNVKLPHYMKPLVDDFITLMKYDYYHGHYDDDMLSRILSKAKSMNYY